MSNAIKHHCFSRENVIPDKLHVHIQELVFFLPFHFLLGSIVRLKIINVVNSIYLEVTVPFLVSPDAL